MNHTDECTKAHNAAGDAIQKYIERWPDRCELTGYDADGADKAVCPLCYWNDEKPAGQPEIYDGCACWLDEYIDDIPFEDVDDDSRVSQADNTEILE